MTPAELPQIEDLEALFLGDTPLLDVRAPTEFCAGAFPLAENHPLIDDHERHEIGLTYKHQGQQSAIDLGHRLVGGAARDARIAAWRRFVERHPGAVLYCFRGGMRSQISQRWLREEAGVTVPRVRGGYKAMRRYLLEQIEHNSARCQPVVIGGRTGVGKTRVVERCAAAIDLERLARHRGSAFGHHPLPQPTQIDFENAFSIALLKRVAADNAPFLVEDESRNIGSRHIPPAFFARMEQAPLVLLEADEDERVEITLNEYVHDALAGFVRVHGADNAFTAWAAYLENALGRIRKRLGGTRYASASTLLAEAIAQHRADGTVDRHRDWIRFLLREYYDGMYGYQLEKKRDRIVFRGDRGDVEVFLAERYGIGVTDLPIR